MIADTVVKSETGYFRAHIRTELDFCRFFSNRVKTQQKHGTGQCEIKSVARCTNTAQVGKTRKIVISVAPLSGFNGAYTQFIVASHWDVSKLCTLQCTSAIAREERENREARDAADREHAFLVRAKFKDPKALRSAKGVSKEDFGDFWCKNEENSLKISVNMKSRKCCLWKVPEIRNLGRLAPLSPHRYEI